MYSTAENPFADALYYGDFFHQSTSYDVDLVLEPEVTRIEVFNMTWDESFSNLTLFVELVSARSVSHPRYLDFSFQMEHAGASSRRRASTCSGPTRGPWRTCGGSRAT
ncbi:MAG: hypothetical protein ACTSU5_10280 [Promethearchaeota archaeon]